MRWTTAGRRAPVLSIFGGKITTYRKLAEQALAELAPFFPRNEARVDRDRRRCPAATCRAAIAPRSSASSPRAIRDSPDRLLAALARRHGTRALRVLGDARDAGRSGRGFRRGLYAREIDYLVARGMGATRRRRAVATHQVRPAMTRERSAKRVAAYVRDTPAARPRAGDAAARRAAGRRAPRSAACSTDIDDTLSTHGRLTARGLRARWSACAPRACS